MRPAVKYGFLGPVLAVVIAAAMGVFVLHRYAGERAETVGRERATQAASWLLTHGPAGVDDLRRSQSIRWAGVAFSETPQGARYPFLRRPVWLAHTDPARQGTPLDRALPDDKAAADLLVSPEVTRLPNGGWRAGAAESLAPGERRVAVAELAPPLRVDIPWPGLLLALGAALLFWYDLTRRVPENRARPAVGAGVSAAALLALLGPRLNAVHALEVPESRASADIGGATMLLAGVVLLPLVIAGVAGALRGSRRSEHRVAYAYIGPALIGLGLLVLVPFLYGVGLAFTRAGHGSATFVGLDNFIDILSSEGRSITEPLSFYFTLVVTLAWTAANVALHAGIGLGLALLLKEPTLRFKGVYRVLFIVPWAVPSYITALVWKGMFNQQYGIVNHLLGLFGVTPVAWFSEFWTAFTANVITNTWLGFPFMMVVSLGALQSIPTDLYEAASVDGADKWQQFKHITLPLLKPAMVPALILGSVWTFNMFNIIYLVSGGQPGHSTDILITQAYRWAFEQDRYGYAAAYSVLIFLILLVWSFFTQRWTRAAEGQG
jgi:ABC-type sugar transport system permease subunit